MLQWHIHRIHFSNEYLKLTGFSPNLIFRDVIGQLSQRHVVLREVYFREIAILL